MNPESNPTSSPLQTRPPGTQPLSPPPPTNHYLACRPRPLAPRYALRQGLGAWELIFEGRRAILKDEMGVPFVAWLLLNQPTEPVPALLLAMRVEPPDRTCPGITEVEHPGTGEIVLVERDAILQERSLALDDGVGIGTRRPAAPLSTCRHRAWFGLNDKQNIKATPPPVKATTFGHYT